MSLPEIAVPWGAWHGDADRSLTFPAEWTIEYLAPRGGEPLSTAQIAAQIDAPIEALPLGEVARGAQRVVVVIDDQTRPTPVGALLPPVIERLETAGVPRDRITVLMAIGAHRPPTAEELAAKLHPADLDGVRVQVHDPGGDLVDTGVALGGVPVRLARTFTEADVRITIGGVMPHPFAAYSGGGKMLIPGLAGLDVVVRSHTFALMGIGVGPNPDKNRFRQDMERAVRDIGLHWTLNVVVTGKRRVGAVTAGDFVAAHRAACEAAATLGATAPPSAPLDALLVNAYPKDTELLQIEAALPAVRNGALQWLREEAPIVLAAACNDAMGHHQLFGPGGTVYRKPMKKTFFGTHPLVVHTPGAGDDDVRAVFWEGYPACREWQQVIETLIPLLPPHPRVGILPFGPLQVPLASVETDGREHGTVSRSLGARQP